MSMGIWYEQIMRYVGPAVKVMAMTKVSVKQRLDENGVMRTVSIPDHVNVLCEMACGAQADLSWSSVSGLQTGTELWLLGIDGTLNIKGPPFTTIYGGRRGDTELTEIPIPPEKRGGWRVEEEFARAIRGEEPDRFRAGAAAGLAGADNLEAALVQDLAETRQLSRFPTPLTALEGDEASAGHGDAAPQTI